MTDRACWVRLLRAARLDELHGSTIHAESPGEGLGATFTVRLPRLRGAPAGESAALAVPASGKPMPAARLDGMRASWWRTMETRARRWQRS